MMTLEDTGIITTAKNLPRDLTPLVDPAQPIPDGVHFSKKRFTVRDVMSSGGIAVGPSVAGLIVTVLGLAIIIDRLRDWTGYHRSEFIPLGIGAFLLFAAWFMAGAARDCYKVMRRQQNGEPMRIGIFVTPNALLQAGDMIYMIISRAQFRGLAANTLRYSLKGQDRSIPLPSALVGADTRALPTAIERWAATPAEASAEAPKQSGQLT